MNLLQNHARMQPINAALVQHNAGTSIRQPTEVRYADNE